eukprot:3858072-Pyramimonas_sp.AAC.1
MVALCGWVEFDDAAPYKIPSQFEVARNADGQDEIQLLVFSNTFATGDGANPRRLKAGATAAFPEDTGQG